MRILLSEGGILRLLQQDLGVVDRHALQGLREVWLCSLLLLLLPSSLLFLCFLSGLLINWSWLDEANHLRHPWKIKADRQRWDITGISFRLAVKEHIQFYSDVAFVRFKTRSSKMTTPCGQIKLSR